MLQGQSRPVRQWKDMATEPHHLLLLLSLPRWSDSTQHTSAAAITSKVWQHYQHHN